MSTIKVDTIATRTGSGNITASNTIAGNLTGNVTGNVTGSGANLTSIPAAQLTGTVADARLSTVSSSKLSGALPALDGSSLTGVGVGTADSINTSGISLNQELNTLEFGQLSVIGTGATVTNIGAGQINISILSLNTTGVTTVVSFGSTVLSNYALDFYSEENQDTTFESNDILESEADDILDFSEGNPFGTF